MSSNIQMPSAKAVISAAASAAATAMLIRSFAKDYIPTGFRHYFFIKLNNFFAKFTNEFILVIDEFDGLSKNQLFNKAAQVYLGSIVTPSTKRIRATLPDKEKKISISMAKNEELIDNFSGFRLKWRMVCKQIHTRYLSEPGDFNPTTRSEIRYYELIFHKKHRDKVVDEYLPYVLERSKAVELEKKTLKLFTLADGRVIMHNRSNPWESVNLDHPATFDTLAMDTDTKKMVMDDLERFVGSKELYRKAGKAWKRGYLLFGPPGTGKSSLIAAMANYLNFDIYDLELTGIRSNSYLRRYLISTTNRSILVVEDIDCSIELTQKRPNVSQAAMYPHQHSRGSRVTLSGLLNFIDGLWSSCGDERIIVFTTNHKDKLDPTLLRPGRMDVHIHMSYCTPCGFKLLASNYLGITEHPLFLAVEQLMKVTKVTPAEVGEQLLKNNEPEIALEGLIEFLEEKKKNEEVEAYNRNQQVSKPALLLAPEEKGGSEEGTICISLETIKQLIKKNQAPHAEAEGQLTKKDEADIVLRGLIQLLQVKMETEELKGGEKDSGSSTGKLLPDFKGKGGNN